MMFLMAFAVATILIPALAAPALIPITKYAGSIKANSYVVKLKDGVSQDSHIAEIAGSAGTNRFRVTYKYDVFHGYAGQFDGVTLDLIRKSPDVEYIQTDTIYQIDYSQGDASRAIRDISEQEQSLTRRADKGEGVTIYGIDTGILTSHECFGGRASWGGTFGEGFKEADGNGHGTHTAGTAVGNKYGVATAAKIVAVKVCSDDGQCSTSDIIAGVNYAVTNATGPTVATMSLGGEADQAIDSAVSKGIEKGMHFTIAAGNNNADAANTSPARVEAANTIGAIDSSDKKASFSNYGSIIDVWALGVDVLSAWKDNNTATNTISGTSMSTPQVAGILAVALGKNGTVSPADLSNSLKSNAKGVVTGVPEGTNNLKAQAW